MSSPKDSSRNPAVEVGDVWLRSVEDRLIKNTAGRRGGTGDLHPTIIRVPAPIRAEDEKAYDPKVISIGPYHRGKERLQSMENLKWVYLWRFVERNPYRRLEDHLGEMKQLETQARSCYSEPIELDSDEFAEMLILDGGFIIEFLLTFYWVLQNRVEDGRVDDPVTQNLWARQFIALDMILLENQLPFFVLQRLYVSLSFSHYIGPPLLEVVFHFVKQSDWPKINNIPYILEHNILHLLHLYHSWIQPPFEQQPLDMSNQFIEVAETQIHSAMRLREAGIKFRRNKGLAQLQAKFSNGVMEMELLMVTDSTIPILQNLIAFEQCYPGLGNYVASYAAFLDSLVDKHTDVSLLLQQGVLSYWLGSDEEVTCLINKLCKYVTLSPNTHLKYVLLDVNKYYNSRWPRWRAKLARDYFANPWSIISLTAALILLSIAIAQTVFSVLSYLQTIPA